MATQRHTLAFRVNDTSITHIEIISSANMPTVLKMARHRLESKGYTVNELVWNKIEEYKVKEKTK